jgi:DNA-binding PadR family transcriptional regulator
MAGDQKLEKYLPLTESTFYIMLTLTEPLHGYAVMQEVERLSEGVVKIGPGTLYGAFSTMESAGLIDMVREEGRRKSYQLTEKGRLVLKRQIDRLNMMVRNSSEVLTKLS